MAVIVHHQPVIVVAIVSRDLNVVVGALQMPNFVCKRVIGNTRDLDDGETQEFWILVTLLDLYVD